ncbi:MAG: MFS transporter [Pseudonocardiaceae bacterium]
MTERRRWLALLVLCLGDLMIVLDTTIVNVALPSIRADLGFSETSLAWVVNGYLLTFGGFLLLAGRMGDLFGHRRLFLIGLTVFTSASLACGLAGSPEFLVGARAVQGLGGAVVSVVALSLIMTMFTEPAERAKAMGFIGFVIAGGGSIGVFLGGLLTDALDWHWIFLVNIPIGAAVIVLCFVLVPVGTGQRGSMESRAQSPLMPLALFRRRSFAAVNIVCVLWAAALFAWFFLAALYLQLVLGYSPLGVGLAFLPANLIMGAFSLGLSERIVLRWGIRAPLVIGMLLVGASLALFARAPVGGNFAVDVLPGMILLGLGMGMSFNPVLLAAMSEVEPSEAGLASGVANTSFMMGGALGLAVLASLADARSSGLTSAGVGRLAALTGGYHAAFVVAAAFAATAAVVGALLLRSGDAPTPHKDREVLSAHAALD